MLNFSDRLDPGRAEDLRNYRLRPIGASGPTGPRVVLSSASYDPVSRTVTLSLARPIGADAGVQLMVNGKPGRGLTDTSGRYLVARPDGNFTATLGRARALQPGTQGRGYE